MSCAGFDLRDYFFGELPEAERASAERHIADCTDCTAELEQLQLVRGSLLTLRDEEMPRRIGFISDKIFGFASAAMLSAALLVVSVRQQPKVVERRVEVASAPAADVKAVVAEAVSAALAQQDKKNRELLEATERRHYYEEHGMALRLADYAENLEKRYQASRSMAMDYGSEVHPLGAKP
jgi:anti-sigma factor RsiW